MSNRPTRNYHYDRAGVAMLTLKTRPGVRLCRITQANFALSPVGKVVQQALLGIPGFHEQVKIGQYQIMPDHLHVLVHVVRDLPPGITLQRIIRGFKLGVNGACAEAAGGTRTRVFEEGMYDTLCSTKSIWSGRSPTSATMCAATGCGKPTQSFSRKPPD